MTIWTILLLAVAAYLVALAIRDFRRKDYVWAVLSLVGAGVIAVFPFPTHSIIVDLPSTN